MAHDEPKWHRVVQGDDLEGIALEHFGSGEERYWRRIWLANRQEIGKDPHQLSPGQYLKLPPRSQPAIQYQVEEGDNLFQLAEWVYGSGDDLWKIDNANPWLEGTEIPLGSFIKIP